MNQAQTLTPATSGRWVLLEVAGATLVAAALIRLQLEQAGWWARLSPAVWVYLPLAPLAFRRLSLAEHGFAPAAWRGGGKWLLRSVAFVLLPSVFLVLTWQKITRQPFAFLPEGLAAATVFEQLALIAIPEELFFRGYVQGRLTAWSSARRLTGSVFSIVLTALLFALAHLSVTREWRSANVFLPGLVMSWLRARTGGLLAPAGFHWLANLLFLSLRL